MTKIVRSKDCGNSPKNRLAENLAVALLAGDDKTVTELTTDDVEWIMVGGEILHGRGAVLRALPKVVGAPVTLTVSHVMTHGKSGAVDGTVLHRAGSARFCEVFEFSNAKGTRVNRIISYRIDEPQHA
jgi:hypothetical protein